VEGARHDLLAGAALAADQHADVAGRDVADLAPQLAHRRAVAEHELLEIVARDLGPTELTFGGGAAGRSLDHRDQLLLGVGLDHVVEGAAAQRRGRGPRRVIAGQHDDRRGEIALAELAQDRQAVQARHVHVEQDDVPALGLEIAPHQLFDRGR
jgi:hypothetical protein